MSSSLQDLLAQFSAKIETAVKTSSKARKPRAAVPPEKAKEKALRRKFNEIMGQLKQPQVKKHPNLLYKRAKGESQTARAWTAALNKLEENPGVSKEELGLHVQSSTGVALSSALDIGYKARRFLNFVQEGFFTFDGDITPSGAAEVKSWNESEKARVAALPPVDVGNIDVQALLAQLAEAAEGQESLPLSTDAESAPGADAEPDYSEGLDDDEEGEYLE